MQCYEPTQEAQLELLGKSQDFDAYIFYSMLDIFTMLCLDKWLWNVSFVVLFHAVLHNLINPQRACVRGLYSSHFVCLFVCLLCSDFGDYWHLAID